MESTTAHRQQREGTYLSTAPAALIRHHGQSSNGKEILGRLLTQTRNTKMERAWTIVSSHINAQDQKRSHIASPNNPYRRLWSEIGMLLIKSRRPQKALLDLDRDLHEIEKLATALRDKIIDPDRTGQPWPRTAEPKTGARFDYPLLYEYFPAEVMKLNMQNIPLPDDAWEQANDMGRADIAHRLLCTWPTLSEVLDELLAKIKQERTKENERKRPVKRDRKTGGDASNRRERYFVVELAQYLERAFQMNRKTESIPVTAAIAAAVFNQKVLNDFVRHALRGR